jgi:hypothetical protein
MPKETAPAMEFYVYREPKQSDNPKIIIWSNGYIIEREVWIGDCLLPR